MSSKLIGNSSLDVSQVPQVKEEKLGLIEIDTRSKLQGFRLSPQCMIALKKLSARLSGEAKIKISMAKAIELAIFNVENKSLNDLLKIK